MNHGNMQLPWQPVAECSLNSTISTWLVFTGFQLARKVLQVFSAAGEWAFNIKSYIGGAVCIG